MSAASPTDADSPAASDVAVRLREAGLVRLVAAPDGDALAATGLLADALAGIETPYQATVAEFPGDADRATDADLTVALGHPGERYDVALGATTAASHTAYEAALALDDHGPDPVLALAGVVAAGEPPQGAPLSDVDSELERRPGLAVPVADPADGLAHSTLTHGPFSGDVERARDLLSTVEGDGRRLASHVALAVAGESDATVGATEAVERILRPYAGGPFETLGGYADVLEAAARTDPALGVALALGGGDRTSALEAWRDHGRATHAAIREGKTGRYDGLFVLRCPGAAPVGTVARLTAAVRSPEPTTLVVGAGAAAAVTETPDVDAAATLSGAATSGDGEATGTASAARARYDVDDTEFVAAVRERLR